LGPRQGDQLLIGLVPVAQSPHFFSFRGKFFMALKTKCLTPGAYFDTEIHSDSIKVEVRLPFELEITEEEAILLTSILHNQVEVALRPYFEDKPEVGSEDV